MSSGVFDCGRALETGMCKSVMSRDATVDKPSALTNVTGLADVSLTPSWLQQPRAPAGPESLALTRGSLLVNGPGVELVPCEGVYAQYLKRSLDVLGGVLLLFLMLPVMLVVALAIRVSLGPGVIYRQRRVGRHGETFTLYKFRTMHRDRRRCATFPQHGERRVCHKRDDDPRHTPLGRLLRKSRLDELPQLWHVVRGEMSLVGPRPELVEVVRNYDSWQHLRHQVRPGLTGLWQVSEGNTGLAHHGVGFDLDYLHKLSFRTDCRILLRTVPTSLRCSGR